MPGPAGTAQSHCTAPTGDAQEGHAPPNPAAGVCGREGPRRMLLGPRSPNKGCKELVAPWATSLAEAWVSGVPGKLLHPRGAPKPAVTTAPGIQMAFEGVPKGGWERVGPSGARVRAMAGMGFRALILPAARPGPEDGADSGGQGTVPGLPPPQQCASGQAHTSWGSAISWGGGRKACGPRGEVGKAGRTWTQNQPCPLGQGCVLTSPDLPPASSWGCTLRRWHPLRCPSASPGLGRWMSPPPQ